jgi:hypothetical protein
VKICGEIFCHKKLTSKIYLRKKVKWEFFLGEIFCGENLCGVVFIGKIMRKIYCGEKLCGGRPS